MMVTKALLSSSVAGRSNSCGLLRRVARGFAALLLVFAAQQALATAPLNEFVVTDGSVESVVIGGNTLYIGGDFSHVGTYTGGSVLVNLIDETDAGKATGWPQINGVIYAVLPTASGGWFLGGDFSSVNDSKHNNLVHITAAGVINSAFNPNVDGPVYALAQKSGGSLLYVGGAFTSLGGAVRTNIAALNASDGRATEWSPSVGGVVRAMLVSTSTLFVGGELASGVIALNLSDDSLLTWAASANGRVNAIAAFDDRLFVGGEFDSVSGQSRNHIVALALTDGAVDALWNPGSTGVVNALLRVADDTSLYVGSRSVATPSTGSVVAMQVADASTIWSVNANGPVNGLAVSDNRLFIGGEFTQLADAERLRLAALKSSDGALLPWDPQANDSVLDVAINGPFSRLLVGGRFGSADRLLPRSNIAAISLSDGGASAWSADVNAPVTSLLLSADNATLYAGGRFSEIDGSPRNRLAALDVTAVPPNTIVTAWNPDVTGSSVDALVLSSGDETLYIGGTFSAVGGVPRGNIAALDTAAATNIATPWNPAADGAVNAMDLFTFNDTQLDTTVATLYVGGEFSTMGGQSRSRIAALDTLSNSTTVTPWSTSVTGVAVNTVALSTDGKSLYIGGEFSAVGGSARSNLAKLDTTVDSASLAAWSPAVGGAVNVMALNHNEEALYLGGEFSTLGGLARRYLGIVDLGAGAGTDWNPAPNAPVAGLAVRGNSIYSGGQFSLIQNRPRVGLAAFVFVGPTTIADPSGRPVLEPQVVSLSCSTSADLSCAAIYFTVDNPPEGGGNPAQISTPTSASPVFSAPLTVDKEGNTYVRFFAIDSEGTSAVVKTEVYGFDTIAPASTAAPLGSEAKALEGGVFLTANGDDRVILSCTDITAGCAAIRYTVNFKGEAPNPKAQGVEPLVYEGPIDVSSFSASQADIKYFSEDRAGNIEEGLVTPVDDNGVATGEPSYNQLIYRIDPSPPTTTASPESMTFESDSLKVTLSCEDNGVGCEKTYFTLDGSTPTERSQQYTGPITISGEEINYTLKFFSTDLVGNKELQKLETYIAIRGDLGGASVVHPLLSLLFLLPLFGRLLFRSGRDA